MVGIKVSERTLELLKHVKKEEQLKTLDGTIRYLLGYETETQCPYKDLYELPDGSSISIEEVVGTDYFLKWCTSNKKYKSCCWYKNRNGGEWMTVENESLEWHLDRAKTLIDQYFEWREDKRYLIAQTALESAVLDIEIAITKIPSAQKSTLTTRKR